VGGAASLAGRWLGARSASLAPVAISRLSISLFSNHHFSLLLSYLSLTCSSPQVLTLTNPGMGWTNAARQVAGQVVACNGGVLHGVQR
jgi:hypothetical protein